jgi:hypothetical protein
MPAWAANISRQLASRGSGPSTVVGNVDGEHADERAGRGEERHEERVERVPRVGSVDHVELRYPAVERDVAVEAVVRHEVQRSPLLRTRQLAAKASAVVALSQQGGPRLVVTGHCDRLERAVGVDMVHRRDLEAHALDDSVDDRLQRLGKAAPGVDPADQLVEAAQHRQAHAFLDAFLSAPESTRMPRTPSERRPASLLARLALLRTPPTSPRSGQ